MTNTSPTPSRQAVFERALRAVQDGDLDFYAELFADDAITEFPFAPSGWPHRMGGREELRRSLSPQIRKVSP